ncbi:MAG: metallophosphoesterase [Sedimentisphaerales bacterium]|nr:metallophosphoesterase [Sedimentisphaerales bacterium]
MQIAVVGDVHGHLAGMYRILARYNQAHDEPIELVLQAGDFGAFPDAERLDGATRKHVKNDPTELGFSAYLAGRRTAPIRTIFIAGNHEDFDFLQSHQDQELDASGKLYCLGNGSVVRPVANVLVGGLWGISTSGPRRYKGDPRKYVDDEACLRLMEHDGGRVDILLCHDVPWDSTHGAVHRGSRRLAEVVECIQPRYVFHGHTSGDDPPWWLGRTQVIGLNQSCFVKIPHRDGGIVLVDTDTWQWQALDSGRAG